MIYQNLDFILSYEKLIQLLIERGDGTNALKISLVIKDGEHGVEFAVVALTTKIDVPKDPTNKPPATDPDGTQLCPVPPGCGANIPCKEKVNDHMAGSAESYKMNLIDNRNLLDDVKYSIDIIAEKK